MAALMRLTVVRRQRAFHVIATCGERREDVAGPFWTSAKAYAHIEKIRQDLLDDPKWCHKVAKEGEWN